MDDRTADLLVNITRLLSNVADQGTCKGCHAEIWWITHRNGKKTPYDSDLTNHFITCPQAARFKQSAKVDHA